MSGEKCVEHALARSAAFAVALVAGALLSSMSTFPAMEHTTQVSKRAGGVDYEYASSFSLHAEEAVAFVEPDFVGWKETYWGRNALKLNSEYFGVVVLLLAGLLFVFGTKCFTKYLLAGFAFLAFLFALGADAPVHRIAYSLIPAIKSFRAPSMMYIWIYFPAFVLAAFSLDRLVGLQWNSNPAVRKRVLIFGAAAAGVFFVYALASGAIAQWWYDSVLTTQSNQAASALKANMPHIKLGGFLVFVWVGAACGLTWLLAAGKINRITFLALLLAAVVIDNVRISYPFLTQCVKPADFFVRQEEWEHSIGQYLLKRDDNIYRVHSLLPFQKFYVPGLDMAYIFDDFTNKNYNEIVQILQTVSYMIAQPSQAQNAALQTQFRNVLSLLNVKYVLSFSPLPEPLLENILHAGNLWIYGNPGCFPRVYLASAVTEADDQEAAIESRLAQSSFEPTFAIVDKGVWNTPADTAAVDSSLHDSVGIVRFDNRAGRFLFDVRSSRRQMLVVGDNFTPGWRAWIDGRPVEIRRTNGAWKGVEVPRGESRIEMVFESQSAARWRGVTLVSAILFGIFAVAALAFEFRKKMPGAAKEHAKI